MHEVFEKNPPSSEYSSASQASMSILSSIKYPSASLAELEESDHMQSWKEKVRFWDTYKFDVLLKKVKVMLEAVKSGGESRARSTIMYITLFLESLAKTSRGEKAPYLTEDIMLRLFNKKTFSLRDDFSNIFQEKDCSDEGRVMFKPELVREKWCFDMLDTLFGKEVAAPYIADEGKFNELKTSCGVEDIAKKAKILLKNRSFSLEPEMPPESLHGSRSRMIFQLFERRHSDCVCKKRFGTCFFIFAGNWH